MFNVKVVYFAEHKSINRLLFNYNLNLYVQKPQSLSALGCFFLFFYYYYKSRHCVVDLIYFLRFFTNNVAESAKHLQILYALHYYIILCGNPRVRETIPSENKRNTTQCGHKNNITMLFIRILESFGYISRTQSYFSRSRRFFSTYILLQIFIFIRHFKMY